MEHLRREREKLEFLIALISIWIFGFIIARLLSLAGRKWRLFSKTNWKFDITITFAQALIVTMIIIFIANN
jgi:hypothetical protein